MQRKRFRLTVPHSNAMIPASGNTTSNLLARICATKLKWSTMGTRMKLSRYLFVLIMWKKSPIRPTGFTFIMLLSRLQRQCSVVGRGVALGQTICPARLVSTKALSSIRIMSSSFSWWPLFFWHLHILPSEMYTCNRKSPLHGLQSCTVFVSLPWRLLVAAFALFSPRAWN